MVNFFNAKFFYLQFFFSNFFKKLPRKLFLLHMLEKLTAKNNYYEILILKKKTPTFGKELKNEKKIKF